MPATSNATANMSRRQAFNGKGLTFIEMIFDTEVTETATTPDTKDSAFEICSQVVEEKGTLLAKSYALGCKATEGDATCIVLEDGSMPCCHPAEEVPHDESVPHTH